MHNWWIAALEHAGLLTQEEATHISNEIRLGLHRENYDEAYRELEAILADKSKLLIDDARRHETGVLGKLHALEARVAALESKAKEKPAKVSDVVKSGVQDAVTEVQKTVAKAKQP